MNRQPKNRLFQLLAIISIATFFFLPLKDASATPEHVAGPGSRLIVTSGLDTNKADDVMTLREAILIATGGTGPKGVNRPLTVKEMTTATVLCTFDSARRIIGDCGEGLDDKIVFAVGGKNVKLTANLPPLIDDGLTAVDGGSVFPTIDGGGLYHGFDLVSNNNQVANLVLMRMKGYGIQATSTGNLVSGVRVININGDGIVLKGGGTSRVYSTWIGANDTAACTTAWISGSGLVMSAGTHDNIIAESMFRCAGQNGILLDGAGTVRNSISGGIYARIDGNKQDGIKEQNGATNNRWTKIPIYNNGGLGVRKSSLSPAASFLYSKIVKGAGFTVSGTGSPGSSVDVFLAAADPSGAGEGGTLLATVPVQSNGRWTATVSGTKTACYTAIQTVAGLGSSVFSKNICKNGTLEIPSFKYYIPAIVN